MFPLSLEKKVYGFLHRQRLLKKEDTVLLALSGGLDSVVLLHLLKKFGFTVGAAHCNFLLRGEEADGDEAFCTVLCREMKVPFTSRRFDTKTYAGENKMSIQMAARALRYDWFSTLVTAHGYHCIATAHHSNDQAETILLNMVSGKGIGSLAGIPVRNKNIVRPLLSCTRTELFQYASSRKLRWRDDSSNEQLKYKRNFLRKEIMPLIHVLNPAAEEQISRLGERMHEWNLLAEEGMRHILAAAVEEKESVTVIHLQRIEDHPAKKTLLWKLLSPYGFDGPVVENIAASTTQSGKSFIAGAYTLTTDRSRLLIEKTTHAASPELQIPATDGKPVQVPGGSLSLRVERGLMDPALLKNPRCACLDAARVSFPLTVRTWREGDRFYPLGMNQSRKLSDYFTDRKISLPEKRKIPLVLSGGEIIWVAGERIDQRYRITESTEEILYILWTPDEH